TGQELGTLDGHLAAVQSVDFSADGTRLASVARDGTLIVWNVATLEERLRKKVLPGADGCVAFREDGAILIAGTKSRIIRVWEVRDGAAQIVAKGDYDQWDLLQFSFSPDRRSLALAVDKRDSNNEPDAAQIHIWDLNRARVTRPREWR